MSYVSINSNRTDQNTHKIPLNKSVKLTDRQTLRHTNIHFITKLTRKKHRHPHDQPKLLCKHHLYVFSTDFYDFREMQDEAAAMLLAKHIWKLLKKARHRIYQVRVLDKPSGSPTCRLTAESLVIARGLSTFNAGSES